jgi:hypothetical protein
MARYVMALAIEDSGPDVLQCLLAPLNGFR